MGILQNFKESTAQKVTTAVLTVATLPSPMVVDTKQMLATVKIIAFSGPREAVNQAIDVLSRCMGRV